MGPVLVSSASGAPGKPNGGYARICVVSEPDGWMEEAIRRCLAFDHAVPERIAWAEGDRINQTPDALLVRAEPGSRRGGAGRFEGWAARAWQPLTVVWLPLERGSRALRNRLQELRFPRILRDDGTPETWTRLESQVEALLEQPVWIVPALAEAIGSTDPAVVEALTAAVLRQPKRLTVSQWSRAVGLVGYQEFEQLFARRGLPTPKRILDWVRLTCVVEYARSVNGSRTRDQLARHFAYPSGDYLGRRAKQLTGFPLGKLIADGPRETLRLLVSDGL